MGAGAVGPFADSSTSDQHLFEDDGDGTLLRDVIDYEPPFGPLGWVADRLFISRQLRGMLAYRHERTREIFDGKEAAS